MLPKTCWAAAWYAWQMAPVWQASSPKPKPTRAKTIWAVMPTSGKTARNAQMYAQPGHAYIYFTYGMHWLLNVVTSPEGVPAAVLIRAILPVEGCARMAVNRPKLVNKPGWLNGPAKLCQALGLSGAQNGQDLCQEQGLLSIESGSAIPPAHIRTDARVGLNSVPEPWKSIPWRFRVDAELLGVSAC